MAGSESTQAVQCTNDSSIVSKLSTSDAGYMKDPFLQYFVSKPARRAPLINRGYYIRMKAVDHVVASFLEENSQNSQIVSLGAGFDTTYWRLHSKGLTASSKYFEIDFPAVMHRKVAIVNGNVHLSSATGGLLSEDSDTVNSEHYCLIGCDVTHLETLERMLVGCGVDFECPTLVMSECVLTYINPQKVNALIKWCAHSFKFALFCAYEQIIPDDGFGLVMQKHFESLSSPLQNIKHYPTRGSQIQRYLSQGWQKCVCCTMNDFYSSLPNEEKMRIDGLEVFDEFEEWHLKCNHYTMLCASAGSCKQSLLPRSEDPAPAFRAELKTYPLPFVKDSHMTFKRYSHSSVKLANGDVLAVGGFGCTAECRAHQRLADVVLIQTNSHSREVFCKLIHTLGDKPGGMMHHKLVLLRDGSVILYGGRASPSKALDHCLRLRVSALQGVWEQVAFHPSSEQPPARWRHSATTAVDADGAECVIIIGGRTSSCSALNDCYNLNVVSWTLRKLHLSLPVGRHSHCALSYRGGVLVFGGLDAKAMPLSSCLHISSCQDKGWKLSQIDLNPSLPHRYSSAGVVVGDVAWLVGGVSLNQCAEIIAVNVPARSWSEYKIQLSGINLLHGITVHEAAESSQIVILGGGGNCFSFGTHFNQTLTLVQLP